MKAKIEADGDFGMMMVSAVRYALWRRTYIAKATSDYLVPLVEQGAITKNNLLCLDRDLNRYEVERALKLIESEKNKWSLDDDCDFESWERLHKAVREKLKGEE